MAQIHELHSVLIDYAQAENHIRRLTSRILAANASAPFAPGSDPRKSLYRERSDARRYRTKIKRKMLRLLNKNDFEVIKYEPL